VVSGSVALDTVDADVPSEASGLASPGCARLCSSPRHPHARVQAHIRDHAVYLLSAWVALLADQWWTVPVFAFCAWWWAPRAAPWVSLVGAHAGIVGTVWALIDATTFADLPGDRFIVAPSGLPAQRCSR
jgi:hypothetical protein